MTMYNINYVKPKVTLLQDSGIGVSELSARTCYDSLESSENACIQNAKHNLNLNEINNIENSELLSSLAWVHHHHSILEHASLSFLVEGTSRGVLQEHARHRIQSISVKSTRYTMSNIINTFVVSVFTGAEFELFLENMLSFNMFVIDDPDYLSIEIRAIYDKLMFQYTKDDNFIVNSIAKSSLPLLEKHRDTPPLLLQKLQEGKKKRNIGDGFKHIVTDNWKVDMVVTFNIRSLKNYFELRDSGSAWFQIQWLAKAMKEVTPNKYLKLIDKEYKNII